MGTSFGKIDTDLNSLIPGVRDLSRENQLVASVIGCPLICFRTAMQFVFLGMVETTKLQIWINQHGNTRHLAPWLLPPGLIDGVALHVFQQ